MLGPQSLLEAIRAWTVLRSIAP